MKVKTVEVLYFGLGQSAAKLAINLCFYKCHSGVLLCAERSRLNPKERLNWRLYI